MCKKIGLLLLVFSLVVASAIAGYADTHTPPVLEYEFSVSPQGIITPFYSYTNDIRAGLSFSGNKASCKATLIPSGDYSCSVTATLYKKNSNGTWSWVASWSGSATRGHTAIASGSKTVSRGTYKVVASGNVGGGLEYPSKSTTKTY